MVVVGMVVVGVAVAVVRSGRGGRSAPVAGRDSRSRPATGVRDPAPAGTRPAPDGRQKSNLSMLLASNTVGGPRTISPSLPMVYLPSLPAVNVSPSAPVIWPEASATPA